MPPSNGPDKRLPAGRRPPQPIGLPRCPLRDETFGPVAAVRQVPDFQTALTEAADDRFGLAATVLTADMSRAQQAWRALPVGTVKINNVFGGAPGGAAQPRRASGAGFGYGPELLDEMSAVKVVHYAPVGG